MPERTGDVLSCGRLVFRRDRVFQVKYHCVRARVEDLAEQLLVVARGKQIAAIHYNTPFALSSATCSVSKPSDSLVDLLVVLAEPAAGEPNGAGRSEHADHEVLHLHRAEVLVVDGGDRFAGDHMGIVHQLFDVIDRRQCRADPFELLAHLAERAVGDPLRHRLVEQVSVSAALTGRGKPGLLDDVGTTDQPHDSLGNGGRAGRDSHPTTVFGEVRIARRVVRGTVAMSAGDRA